MTEVPDHLQAIAAALKAQKIVLNKRVELIHAHARDPLNADSAEQAAELGNVSVVSALENDAVIELAEIEAALQKLANGSYGTCISCGEDIGAGRLEARPASSECLQCAEDTQRRQS
jgi:RNA polymerase-binding transcription factor DksA